MAHNVELVLDAQAQLGEGPLWDPQRQVLFWLDILNKQLHIYDPKTDTDRCIQLDRMPGTVVRRAKGGLMMATEGGFESFDLDSGQAESWSDPESDKPTNRFNDGKCDPAGRFWAGTMPYDEGPPTGALYCLDCDRSVRQVLKDVCISNGIAWSADRKTMYYVDSLSQAVDAFDYDVKTGAVSNRRHVVEITKELGFPDGMTIDSDGKLWVAVWGGSGVYRFDPTSGRQIDKIDLPTAQVTACWFGGGNLDELYITTARVGLDGEAVSKQPLAGGLFRAQPGPRGVEAFEYGG